MQGSFGQRASAALFCWRGALCGPVRALAAGRMGRGGSLGGRRAVRVLHMRGRNAAAMLDISAGRAIESQPTSAVRERHFLE